MAQMLAVIGGTGLGSLKGEGFVSVGREEVATDYGAVAVERYAAGGRECLFLPRHGAEHKIPPHLINYRANIDALRRLGVGRVLAVNAVGGIHPKLVTGGFAVPEQIIDYTWGRESSFSDGSQAQVTHIDFTHPYSEAMRQAVLQSLRAALAGAGSAGADGEEKDDGNDGSAGGAPPVMDGGICGGTYGCTQGPRLETAAEVRRLQADGCDMVGMTGMPEAALAREAGLDYASLCLSVNRAAGLGGEEELSLDAIKAVMEEGMVVVLATIRVLLSAQG